MDAARMLIYVRRWWWLLLTGTLIAVASYGVAARLRERTPEPTTYRAQATLFVSPGDDDAALAASPAFEAERWNIDRLMATHAQIATGERVADRAALDLRIDVPADQLRASISAAPRYGTHLLDIAAVAATPGDAEALRDAVLRSFDRVLAESQLPGRSYAYERLPATAQADDADSPALTVLLVALGGMLGAALVVLAFEYMSDAVRDERDGAEATGLPSLGVVPAWRASAAGRVRIAGDEPRASSASERYRMLRATAQALFGEARVLLVTAPAAGCGVSTTAANLAGALAQSGKRVALVDAAGDTGAALANNDVVIIDAPPALTAAAATELAGSADAVLLVLRADRTTRAQATAATALLRRAGATRLATVLNAGPVTGAPAVAAQPAATTAATTVR